MSSCLVFIANLIHKLLKMFDNGPAWITPIARVQAVFQAFFRPAVWFPIIKRSHSYKEKWVMPSSSSRSNMEDILRGLMTVIQTDKSGSYWKMKKADPNLIQVHVFTRFEWLDIIEFTIDGSDVEVWSFSSGFLPLWIPCACFLNLFFCWIPFWDFGLHKKRITRLLEAMDMGIQRV